jgi:hypothetical protein
MGRRSVAQTYHYTVPSSGKGRYRVVMGSEDWNCPCKGYQMRHTCRHVDRCRQIFLSGWSGTQAYPYIVDGTDEEHALQVAEIRAEIERIQQIGGIS